MKIEYIGHACLLIDTGKIKIATDPWFYGPAYSWNRSNIDGVAL